MSKQPPPLKVRWYAGISSLLFAATFGISMAFVDAFGTYTAFQIPSLQQAVGILTIGLFWFSTVFGVIILKNNEDFVIDLPVSGIPIFITFLSAGFALVIIDYTLFASSGFEILALFASDHQSLLTLVFSGMLVLLYFDQHKTQRKQVELMDQQAELVKERIDWRKSKERPRISVDNWKFFDDSASLPTESDDDIPASEMANFLTNVPGDLSGGLLFSTLSNRGNSAAWSLRLRIEVMVNSKDLPDGYLHLNGSFLFVRSDMVRLDETIQDQYLNRNPTLVNPDEMGHILAGFSIISTGEADVPPGSIGELIDRLPFPVDDIVLRASFSYTGPSEEGYSTPVAAVRLDVEELDTLADAYGSDRQVGYHGVPTFGNSESQEYFEEEFAETISHRWGGLQIKYYLEDTE